MNPLAIDGDRACREGLSIVFVVDQNPFEVGSSWTGTNHFCVLQPLMTLDGERLRADAESFPNRGRVWWLLNRTVPLDLVVAGAIWSGPIEEARVRGDKDHFQARLNDIHPGGSDLLEIIDVPGGEVSLESVHRGRPTSWTWPRPLTQKVMLRGKTHVVGPLLAAWDPVTRRVKLSAPEADKPEVLRVSVGVFDRIARVERFRPTLFEHDRNSDKRTEIELTLSKTAWLNLKKLREEGETLDASTDQQIIHWATKALPRRQRQEFQNALNLLESIETDTAAEPFSERKRERLQRLVTDRSRVLEMGEEVARLLATTPAFEELLRKHADSLVSARVEGEVSRRNTEIERLIEAKREELRQLQTHFDGLEDHYRRERERRERQIEAMVDERLKIVEERESRLFAREQGLTEREREVARRLETATKRYVEETDRVLDDMFAQLPVLVRLGRETFSANDGAPAGAVNRELRPTLSPAPIVPVPSRLPPIGPPVAQEDELIEQFRRVVEYQGYSFKLEDLINFHVCVKIGGLTILAGLSGTGKSSLPRLYAEAIGANYLAIPVRPDWLDDRDLVGAFNAIARRFEPSSCGLIEHLVAAADDKKRNGGGIFLVCLDEMNLARVEHYFAQFLSVLELPPEQRKISLFAGELLDRDDPYLPYEKVPIGDNVRFMGTVNIDETTHFFSPKVLDRSQVATFAAPDLSAQRPVARSGTLPRLRPVELPTFTSWIRPGNRETTARDFLLKINSILRKARFGLGYRQFDRMLMYVASSRPFLAENTALDYQLTQVVLPRLRSASPSYRDALENLRAEVSPERYPRAADFLTRMLEEPNENDFFQLV